MENSNKFHKKKLVAGIVLSVLFALILACGIYLSDYYKADFSEIERVLGKSENQLYEKSLLKEGTLCFLPKAGAKTGFVFYPGGKVQYNAYEPLLAKLAEKGIACFLVKMPFNLAVFNINGAEEVLNQFPEIENWFIGGHSLGGSMAASFLDKNQFLQFYFEIFPVIHPLQIEICFCSQNPLKKQFGFLGFLKNHLLGFF